MEIKHFKLEYPGNEKETTIFSYSIILPLKSVVIYIFYFKKKKEVIKLFHKYD